MTQSLGVVDITWRGVKYPCEKGATFKQGGLVNKVVYAGRQTFRSQEPMASEVKFSTPLTGAMSLGAFSDGQEGELQFICDTGQTYVSPNAFVVGQVEITGGEGGKMTVTFNANTAEELLP
jgi:hypothetical protein